VAYPRERKAAVLKKMQPPNNVPLRQLSREEGISEATLHSWRKEARGKGQLLPDADAGPEGWNSRDKFATVVETAAMNEADLSEYSDSAASSSSRSGPGAPPVSRPTTGIAPVLHA